MGAARRQLEGVKQKSHTEMFPSLCGGEELIGRKLQSLVSELGDIQKHLVELVNAYHIWFVTSAYLWPSDGSWNVLIWNKSYLEAVLEPVTRR